MRGRHYFVIAVVVMLIGSGSAWVRAQSERGNPTTGQKIYEQHCLRCHGDKLDGQGPEAKWLIVPPANFLSLKSRGKDDWELLVSIYHGVLFTPMHGFRDTLSYDQMRDVLAYIRRVAPYGGAS